ncbi:prephenate dehydrogenase [Niameybacter massiliensis]|uniref:Prephenate dehydrogenase n=1 Tax=Holtiella tumoricola TaxID=3018743 RepID=A0AA42J132_9FIRM|nr:prephenate dehydrogenase [Holtiella tumoricola]MDA3732062.1 prephenate dehydrogenase [Holtiella tumoricola]
MRIGIIGLGLIGGSIAKTLKKVHAQNSYIIGYDTHSLSCAKALDEGAIDHIAVEIGEDFVDCNVIFLCTPVSAIDKVAAKLLPYVSKDCILTDIGSTKHDTVEKIGRLISHSPKKCYFIGGHPMTGSEQSGYEASTSYLFENAYYILTPLKGTPDFILFIMQKMIERLGAIAITLEPDYHDFATAAVSHLPHIIASSLVHLVKNNDGDEHLLHTLAAGGFKDITRIASSNPAIWQDICLSNKTNIQTCLKKFIDSLSEFSNILDMEEADNLYDFFNEARNYRDSFQDGIKPDIAKVYTIFVDAEDEPGIIACIATLLSSHSINIKDIGIVNHREFSSGVLRIAFGHKHDMQKAHQLLTKHNYTVYC